MPFFKEKNKPVDLIEAAIDIFVGATSVAAVVILCFAFEFVRGGA